MKAAAVAAAAGSFAGKRHLSLERKIDAVSMNRISQQTALIDQAGGVGGGAFGAAS